MELKEIPEHLLIIGGGYIAAEFGQMFKDSEAKSQSFREQINY